MDFLIIIPETIAIILSGSATLLSDVIKCANEMLATAFALLVIRRVTLGGKFSYDYGMGKFESLTRIITGGVMFVSLCILFLFTTYRLLNPEPFDIDAAIIGIPLMILASHRRFIPLENLLSPCTERAVPDHRGPVAAPQGQDLLRPPDPPRAGIVCPPCFLALGGVYRSNRLLHHHRVPPACGIP